MSINVSIENLLVGGTFYTERLINIDSLSFTKEMSDLFWGIASFSDIELELDNSDNFVTDKHNAVDLRGQLVTLTLYDKEDASSQEIFNGVVSSISLGDTAKIKITDQDLLTLDTELPKRIVTTADFPNATDLGEKISIIWGLAKKVKASYIGFDNTLLEFDYLVGEKTIDDVLSVYRDDIALPVFIGTAVTGTSNTITLAAGDKKPDDYYNWTWIEITGGLGAGQIRYATDYDSATNKITVDTNWTTTPNGTSTYRIREWRFYDGTQGSPYAGFSFIRFKKRQSTGNRLHTITADVEGMQDESNWARAIRSLLSNSTWGLGEAVNATSFDAAEAEIDAIGGLYVDGAITEGRRAFDILNDLLIIRGGRLEKNNADEWTLTWDKPRTNIVKAFGANDGKYNNIVSVGDIEYRDASDATKKVTIRYRYDYTSTNNEQFKQTLSRNALSFGKELIIENQFVRDHTTADKLISYVSKKLIAGDRQISLSLGPEAKDVILGNLISLQIPRYNIANPYDLLSVTNLFGEKEIIAFPYDVTVYDYSAQTLPVDENPDTATDLSRTPPGAVTSLLVTGKTALNNDGSVNSWFEISWTSPTSNYLDSLVELKRSADAVYNSVGSGVTTFKTGSLEPGINYDIRVTSSNGIVFGIPTDAVNQTALGDTTSPATPGTPTGILKFRTWEWSISYTKPTDFSEFEWVITDAAGSTIQTILTKSEKISRIESGTTSLTRRAKVRALDLTGNPSAYSSLSASLSTGTIVSGDVGSGQIGGGGGAGHIVPLSIVGGDIVVGSITATQITVTSLSSLSANFGLVTSGIVEGATFRTAASGQRVVFDSGGIEGFNTGGVKTFDFNIDGTGRLGPSTANNIYWNNTALIVTGEIISTGNIPDNAITNPKILSVAYSKLTAISINAGDITTGTITAITYQTGASGRRVEISAASGFRAYNAAGQLVVELDSSGNATFGYVASGKYMKWNNATATLQVFGQIISDANISDVAFSKVTAVSINAATITSGTITAITYQTATSGRRIEISSTGLLAYNSAAERVLELNSSGDVIFGYVVSGKYMKWNNTTATLEVFGSIITNANLVGGIESSKIVSLDYAKITSVAVVDAQIVNVAVSKLTAGTITTAGVMNFTSGADIIMRRTASDTNLIKFQNTSGTDKASLRLTSTDILEMRGLGTPFEVVLIGPTKVRITATTIDVGDSNADNLVFKAKVDSHMTWDDNNTWDIADATARVREIFSNNVLNVSKSHLKQNIRDLPTDVEIPRGVIFRFKHMPDRDVVGYISDNLPKESFHPDNDECSYITAPIGVLCTVAKRHEDKIKELEKEIKQLKEKLH
jgi:hypothetical protein